MMYNDKLKAESTREDDYDCTEVRLRVGMRVDSEATLCALPRLAYSPPDSVSLRLPTCLDPGLIV
jgi:hypothetical protein